MQKIKKFLFVFVICSMLSSSLSSLPSLAKITVDSSGSNGGSGGHSGSKTWILGPSKWDGEWI